jgi:hypothetical protein
MRTYLRRPALGRIRTVSSGGVESWRCIRCWCIPQVSPDQALHDECFILSMLTRWQ